MSASWFHRGRRAHGPIAAFGFSGYRSHRQIAGRVLEVRESRLKAGDDDVADGVAAAGDLRGTLSDPAGFWRGGCRCPKSFPRRLVFYRTRVFAFTAARCDPPRTLALDRHAQQWLQDATDFSTHAHVFNGLWVIRTLRRYKRPPHSLLDPLTRAVDEAARTRAAGSAVRAGRGPFDLPAQPTPNHLVAVLQRPVRLRKELSSWRQSARPRNQRC